MPGELERPPADHPLRRDPPRPLTTDEYRRASQAGIVGLRPDFVMAGMAKPGGGVILYASTTLTEAELKREMKGFDRVPITPDPAGPCARVPVETATLTAVMTNFVLIHAASYPEALASLQDLWRATPRPLPPG